MNTYAGMMTFCDESTFSSGPETNRSSLRLDPCWFRVSNPCFDDVHLRMSADVLLEGTGGQAETRMRKGMANRLIKSRFVH